MRKSDKYVAVKKIDKNVQKNLIKYEEMCYKCWKRVAKADVECLKLEQGPNF